MARPKNPEFKTKADYDNYYMNYANERLNCLMPKGTKDRIKIAMDKGGIKSMNKFIAEAIEEKLFKCGIPKQIVIEDQEQKQDN